MSSTLKINPPQPSSANLEIRRLTRRSFATGGLAAMAGILGLSWLSSREREDGIPWPLRRVLQFNESLSQTVFNSKQLAPTFDLSLAGEPRVNGNLGLESKVDAARWKLDILSPGNDPVVGRSLPLAAIRALPRYEMVTEFKCVEGWRQVAHWAGARLADFCDRFGRESPYIALVTPDREYYVGLEQASARHSKSLLAYEMNGQPLTPGHGAPLRLVCPLKYGVKSIKRIGSIQFTHDRPADYWAERGYDWYLGH